MGTISARFATNLSGISDYLSSILSTLAGEPGAGRSFVSVLGDTFFYHIIAFVLSFFVLGFLFIPVLSCIRGYIFAFSVSIIVRYYGSAGILPALLLFGLESFISTPCFVFLSTQSFCASMRLTSLALSGVNNGFSPYNSGFIFKCAACFLILLAVALASYLLSGVMFSFVLNTI